MIILEEVEQHSPLLTFTHTVAHKSTEVSVEAVGEPNAVTGSELDEPRTLQSFWLVMEQMATSRSLALVAGQYIQ